MKNKKAKSKVQAILMERNMKIVDLFNKIKEENAKPVAKYMISQIVNGKRTNYEIITLNKICKALNVSANEIIEDNPTRYSSTKGIKSNTPKPRAKRSGRVVVPEVVDVDINMHSGNGYIDDIVDEKALEDIKRTLNMKEEEEERETRIYNDSFNVDPKDRIAEEEEEEEDDFGF